MNVTPMGDSMLYLASIGKARQPAPSEGFLGPNFSLQCAANEYRLANRTALCAGRALAHNLFEQIPPVLRFNTGKDLR
jgi:hypothetical protein